MLKVAPTSGVSTLVVPVSVCFTIWIRPVTTCSDTVGAL